MSLCAVHVLKDGKEVTITSTTSTGGFLVSNDPKNPLSKSNYYSEAAYAPQVMREAAKIAGPICDAFHSYASSNISRKIFEQMGPVVAKHFHQTQSPTNMYVVQYNPEASEATVVIYDQTEPCNPQISAILGSCDEATSLIKSAVAELRLDLSYVSELDFYMNNVVEVTGAGAASDM